MESRVESPVESRVDSRLRAPLAEVALALADSLSVVALGRDVGASRSSPWRSAVSRSDVSPRSPSRSGSVGEKGSAWKVFELSELIDQHDDKAVPYLEFLRVPSLSCGIYTLDAGAKDLQGPHDEDEVYYVISGRARLRVGEEERNVGPGSLLYVRATSDHSEVPS